MECPTTVQDGELCLGELSSVHPFHRPLWTGSAPMSELGKEDGVHEQLYVGKMDKSWALAYHYLSMAHAGMRLRQMPVTLSDIINGADWHRVVPPKLTFTPNLTILGTFNVDETTYSFSPKVLDRAFVMEFNEMNYEHVCGGWPGYADARAAFGVMHAILRPENLHFGYRTVREVLDYIQESGGNWADQGDFCMVSKILPKLRGGEEKLGPILPVFLAFALTGWTELHRLHSLATDLVAEILDARLMGEILGHHGLDRAVYPLTAEKLFRMTRQLLETGLASYF
jgi:hypothetical protein